VDEMERFRKFHADYSTLSAEEKERVFTEHCKSNYVFARSYLDKDGKLKADQGDSILWHMSVIKPAFSFNKFIAQILPYAIKGVVWYQGETNALVKGDPQYAEKQRILIEGWRKLWNQGEFPFFLVQIAPCGSYPLLTDFWLQQYLAVRNTPRTALISTVDIGDLKDAHPKNKRDVGLRLALLALKDAYGIKETVASGPVYKSFKVNGATVEVAFDNIGTGLATKDGHPPDWFEVAGPDKKFKKVQAVIEGDKVVITSPPENPEYVRFAWNYLAEPNLRNKEGLPAFPFNTAEAFFQSPAKPPETN
jgi:sialate O-acetylesterase